MERSTDGSTPSSEAWSRWCWRWLVLALVVPSRATARPRELAGALLYEMAAILDETVGALTAADEQGADRVLARARDTESLTGELSAAVTEGVGAARLPVLWRRRGRGSADAAARSPG